MQWICIFMFSVCFTFYLEQTSYFSPTALYKSHYLRLRSSFPWLFISTRKLMGGATGGCGRVPLTFAACTQEGVQQNSNSTSHSHISRPACSQNALFQTWNCTPTFKTVALPLHKITTLIIHNSLALSFPTQKLPSPEITISVLHHLVFLHDGFALPAVHPTALKHWSLITGN